MRPLQDGHPSRARLPVPGRHVKSCARYLAVATIQSCPTSRPPATETARIPLRPQDEVECRRCEVHCDRVVYPGACIARGCPFVYAYEAWGHTYMGCLQKVFDVEIDLDLLGRARGPAGGLRRGEGAADAAADVPLEISACYEHRADEVGCRNPEFFELPLERPSFRVFAEL